MIDISDQLRFDFENGEIYVFGLNEDGCSGIEVIGKYFECIDDFKIEYTNLHNKNNKKVIEIMPHFRMVPNRVPTIDVPIYFDKGEFITNLFGAWDISDKAIFIGEYFGVEYG